jgi:hypothetical protein
MDGPLWSFLLDRAPIQRQVQREISRARDEIEQRAQDALDNDRERHRKALGDAEQRIIELQRSVGELRGHVADLEAANREFAATNRDLRSQLVAWQDTEQRRRDQEDTEARNTTSDLFCCQNPDCLSLWLLSRRPDRSYNYSYATCGPIGPGCATCTAGEPSLRLAAIKADVTGPDEIARIARPVDKAPESAVRLPVPGGNRSARTDWGVRLVAVLLQRGPDTAIADTVAHQASTFVRNQADRIVPATGCTGLSAIADGLDQVPKVIRNGIAWCATEILGVPEFPATVLGEVITRVATVHVAPLHALHTVAQGIRAVGAVSCAADDHLGRCQCARHLVSNVAETAVAGELQQALECVSDMHTDVSRASATVSEALSPYDRFTVSDRRRWHDIGGI